jgi:hypothetical protein
MVLTTKIKPQIMANNAIILAIADLMETMPKGEVRKMIKQGVIPEDVCKLLEAHLRMPRDKFTLPPPDPKAFEEASLKAEKLYFERRKNGPTHDSNR